MEQPRRSAVDERGTGDMKLELESGPWREPLTDDSIGIALGRLNGDDCAYAILSESDDTYIQSSGSPDGGFILEYQVGDVDHHFQSLREDIPILEVARAFQKYARGDDAWRTAFEWRKLNAVEFKTARPRGLFAVLALLLVGLVAILRCLK